MYTAVGCTQLFLPQRMIQHNPKKLVHASDFMYRANRFDWLGGTQQEQLYHSVWQGLRAGNARMFLMPKSICCHRFLDNKQSATTAWEVYDMNLAGCLLCGDMHVCQVSVHHVAKR